MYKIPPNEETLPFSVDFLFSFDKTRTIFAVQRYYIFLRYAIKLEEKYHFMPSNIKTATRIGLPL